jgi:hypothetical protein
MEFSKFGLCVWNVWGDDVIDRPDNIDETITATMIDWLARNGYINAQEKVCQFQVLNTTHHFAGPDAALRSWAYNLLCPIADVYPELDYLFIRWRWDLGIENDERLNKQRSVLNHYLGTDTKIFVWDDDFKMSPAWRNRLFGEYSNVSFVEISETAHEEQALSYIPYPLKIDKDLALSRVLSPAGTGHGDHLDTNLNLVYVGNNYDREEFVDRYVTSVASYYPGSVHFYGNWHKYDTDISQRYSHIGFHPKVNKSMCKWLYQHAVAVPMLAKDVYFKRGHITPRLYETVMAGGIPIGFDRFKNHEKYFKLVVSSSQELTRILSWLKGLSFTARRDILDEQLDLLIDNKIFDVDEFFKGMYL